MHGKIRVPLLLARNAHAMHRNRVSRLCMAVPFVLSGCLLGPDHETPGVDLPEAWRAVVDEPVSGHTEDPVEWWTVFGDPVLTALIEEAFEQNLSIRAAGLRVIQARAGRSMAFQLLFPAILGEATAARSYYSQEVRPDVDVSLPKINIDAPSNIKPKLEEFLENLLPDVTKDGELDVEFADHVDVYSGSLNALWELDVFGKTRRRIEAAAAEIEAAVGAYDSVLVSLAGEVALTYVQIRTAEAQLEVTRAQVEALKAAVADASARTGPAAEVAERIARAALRDVEADLSLVEQSLAGSTNALCVLLAIAPRDLGSRLGGSGPIPEASPRIAMGVPADLLRRRPDIRAAERMAAAQCARIGVARAQAIAPSFKLFGSLGVAASDVDDLADSDAITAAYGAGLGWNILAYPWLVERVRLEDALYEERILHYTATVLRAAREVEDAAVGLLKARQRMPLLSDGARSAREAHDLAAAGYRRGDIEFPLYMDALQLRVRAEQREVSTRGETALRMIAVYKALGGGWQVREGRPFVPEDMKERMRERSDWWTFAGKQILEGEVVDDDAREDDRRSGG